MSRCIVTEGVSGLLTPPGEPEALGSVIEALLEDGACAQRMGEAGRADFAAQHAGDHVAARYEQAARRAVERHARARRMSSINAT